MPSLSPKRGDDKRGDEIGLMVQHRSTAHAVIASSTLLFLLVLLRGGSADTVTAVEGWRSILIVDAGSSGCRMHAYRWRVEDGEVFVDPKHDSLKVKPGLSSFRDRPADAGPSLEPLVAWAKEHVPGGASAAAATPLFLKATAGLRMLEPAQSEAILESVRATLAGSGFLFSREWAKVIDGTEEGGLGWVAANYLLGSIGKHGAASLERGAARPAHVGLIEVGGASAQVTQLARAAGVDGAMPPGYAFEFSLGGERYTLYTHSYLGYGMEAARASVTRALPDGGATDPCLQRGYAAAEGAARESPYDGASATSVAGVATDGGACFSAAHALFSRTAHCEHDACSFGGVYQPARLARTPMLAFENVHYVTSALGIDARNASPRAFRAAADGVCAETWDGLNAAFPRDAQGKDNNVKWCFGASYLAAFLGEGLGLAADHPVRVQQFVGGFEIEWALGAAIKEASDLANREGAGGPAAYAGPVDEAPSNPTLRVLALLVLIALSAYAYCIFCRAPRGGKKLARGRSGGMGV